MANSGPIVIIEDDVDDEAMFQEILIELNIKNELVWFQQCDQAYDYLKSTTEQPFIIFSDINLPMQSGIEFKRQIDNDPDLRRKSIPFVFYSTAVSQADVNEAYTQMTIQGFFRKRNSFSETKEMIRIILDYWLICQHPNTR